MGEYYRSKSYGNNNNNNQERCYRGSYETASNDQQFGDIVTQIPRQAELRKGKSANASSSSSWCFSDPEMQRKKRVASYKSYTVEGKIKRSFSKSFRWLKHRYSNIIQGS